MNDAEASARGHRARLYRDEFLTPLFDDLRAAYAERLIEVGTRELDPKLREQKITSLSTALKLVDNLQRGIDAFIMDGAMAEKNLLKVEKVERMSAPQRRLFNIAPY